MERVSRRSTGKYPAEEARLSSHLHLQCCRQAPTLGVAYRHPSHLCPPPFPRQALRAPAAEECGAASGAAAGAG
jgi:hypothetical protein